jgi:hypothetical protein
MHVCVDGYREERVNAESVDARAAAPLAIGIARLDSMMMTGGQEWANSVSKQTVRL